MRNSEPPRLSVWLLERLAPRHRRESLVGDLREQVHRGRSLWWYRRQVIGTILVGLAADLAAHKLLAVRALAIGWTAMFLVYQFVGPLIQEMRMTLFSRWGSALWGDSEVLRQLWVYYGLPFVLVGCLIFMALAGWLPPAPPPPPRHRNCVLGDSADTGNVPGAGDTPLAGNRVVARLGVGVVPLGAPVSGIGFRSWRIRSASSSVVFGTCEPTTETSCPRLRRRPR